MQALGVHVPVKNRKSEKAAKSLSVNPSKTPEQKTDSMSESILSARDTLSSERYQAFVENIEEGVYEVDIDGNFLYFNDSLCRIFGYPREEVQFQSFAKFMDESQAEEVVGFFRRMYETGQGVFDLLWRIVTEKGDHKVVELSANLITNKEGERVGFRGIVRDITEKFRTQEALEKSERRLRALFRFVPYPIVVFTLDGRVSFVNPAFTETFGWTFEELDGKTIPYVPPGLEQETRENIQELFKERIIRQHETQRLTKDGRILDVALRASVFSERGDEPSGELVILRDITHEKRIARNNEALLRTSLALPEYPSLEDLLDYVSGEVKSLLGVEGSLVILLDEEKNELFFKSAAFDDSAAEKRVKEIRFPADKGVAGKVVRTGEPIIVPDTSKDPNFYSGVDIQAGFRTQSMLDVPLRSKDRIIGVLCAMNKKTGTFDNTDVKFLNMIAGTVALSIENARFSDELKEAYNEVSSLNRAKDKVINHLSHELRTPLSVLGASLNILGKRLSSLPDETWQATIERARRNLKRILDMQYQVEDIMRERHYDVHYLISWLLDECADELESLVAEEGGEGRLVESIRRRIDEIFGPKDSVPKAIALDGYMKERIKALEPSFSHRKVEIITKFKQTPPIYMPLDPLQKVIEGLIKNAIENTPDMGKIEVIINEKGDGTELIVHDYGVGITQENQRRIFEGFFTTQDTMAYSSKRPFDFNAGGKGADLLRMKIFSERYNFKIDMVSSRCGFIPKETDICPGNISDCSFCTDKEDCYRSGETMFTLFFPKATADPGQ
jgi:PAS domain S-box-containing protein